MAQGMERLDNGHQGVYRAGGSLWYGRLAAGPVCHAAPQRNSAGPVQRVWDRSAGLGTMPGTVAYAQRWSWMPMLRPCAAVLCRKRRGQSILPLFAPTCGHSAKAARNRGNMTSPPATRPILPADMSARMPAAPRPGMTAAARCRMLPPVRPVPCTMAASWPYATARNRWRRCLPRSAPLGWSPSG